MILRQYEQKDKPLLMDALQLEGWNGEEEEFDGRNKTYIAEEDGRFAGFFTYRVERHGYPHLVHFLLDNEHRGHIFTLGLIGFFKNLIKQQGHREYIIHAVKRRKDLCKIIEWYSKRKPYDESSRHRFYLMEA